MVGRAAAGRRCFPTMVGRPCVRQVGTMSWYCKTVPLGHGKGSGPTPLGGPGPLELTLAMAEWDPKALGRWPYLPFWEAVWQAGYIGVGLYSYSGSWF